MFKEMLIGALVVSNIRADVKPAVQVQSCVSTYDGVDRPVDNRGTVEFFDIAAIQACTDSVTGLTTWNNLKQPGQKGYVSGKIDDPGQKNVSGYYYVGRENWGNGVIVDLYRPIVIRRGR